MWMFTDNGVVVGDVALLVIAVIAAVASMVRMTGWPTTLKRAGYWLTSTGWLLIVWRVATQLMQSGDAQISTLGQVALAVIGTGTVLWIVGDAK